jgi:hypothetical protein
MNAAATLIAGALIGAAIMFSNHWTMVHVPGDPPSALRMDRWSGTITFCTGLRTPGIMKCPIEGSP